MVNDFHQVSAFNDNHQLISFYYFVKYDSLSHIGLTKYEIPLTSDGEKHKSPSGAARSFNGGKPIDGWLAWKLENGSKLGSLREL